MIARGIDTLHTQMYNVGGRTPMKSYIYVFVLALLAAPLWGQMPAGPNDLFMAVNGNRAWSGRLAEPNAEKTDGPLPSPQAAIMRIRQLKASAAITFPVTVWIRGGTYPLRRPLNFSPEDSGPVTFAAYPGEQPVLDGGERIKDWTEQRVNGSTVWVADVKDMLARHDYFHSLFVNGERRQRARLPKKGAYRILDVPGLTARAQLFEGSDTFKVTPGEVRNWRNLHDVEIRVLHYWTDERMPIESVDESTGLVKSDRTSIFSLQEGYTGKWAEYWIENVFESLGSEPGEWYLDRTEKKLYYVPMPGESTRDSRSAMRIGCSPRRTASISILTSAKRSGASKTRRPVSSVKLAGIRGWPPRRNRSCMPPGSFHWPERIIPPSSIAASSIPASGALTSPMASRTSPSKGIQSRISGPAASR
jgi:hypothetical protein